MGTKKETTEPKIDKKSEVKQKNTPAKILTHGCCLRRIPDSGSLAESSCVPRYQAPQEQGACVLEHGEEAQSEGRGTSDSVQYM